MAKPSINKILLHQPKEIIKGITTLDSLVLIEINSSKEEKDYQRLINEKLKSAADWDLRDSRAFSIG